MSNIAKEIAQYIGQLTSSEHSQEATFQTVLEMTLDAMAEMQRPALVATLAALNEYCATPAARPCAQDAASPQSRRDLAQKLTYLLSRYAVGQLEAEHIAAAAQSWEAIRVLKMSEKRSGGPRADAERRNLLAGLAA